MAGSDSRRVAANWSSSAAGAHYATHRFRTRRAAQRDPRAIAAVLRDFGVEGRVLDVPCGTGRLRETLERFDARAVGADVSQAMLAQAREAGQQRLLCADVERLPFADRTFDVVVCCRLLHHLREREQLERAVAELVRVSRRLVVASFWDAASWPQWRVRLGLARARGRFATSRATIAQCFASSGAPPVEFRSVWRYVSQQTFVVAERS